MRLCACRTSPHPARAFSDEQAGRQLQDQPVAVPLRLRLAAAVGTGWGLVLQAQSYIAQVDTAPHPQQCDL